MKKFGLEKAFQKCTPIVTHVKLSKDEQRVFVVQSLYRSMIGTLLYLNPVFHDITFSKGVCFRYQANPTIRHLTQVKHIIKYINGTFGYGILYYFETNFTLVGYCDVDWVGNVEDSKNTFDACFFLGNNLIP